MPNHFGGEQEKQLRPGTQAMPLIAAFGKAVQLETESAAERKEHMKMLESYFKESIFGIEGILLNSKENAIPNIVNISVPGIRSEIMLHFLENRGIYVSSGSACALGAKSHVLAAMGYDSSRIDSAVRISFGRETEKEDIDELVAALKDAMNTLCR
jgi:cysteine desulfurase